MFVSFRNSLKISIPWGRYQRRSLQIICSTSPWRLNLGTASSHLDLWVFCEMSWNHRIINNLSWKASTGILESNSWIIELKLNSSNSLTTMKMMEIILASISQIDFLQNSLSWADFPTKLDVKILLLLVFVTTKIYYLCLILKLTIFPPKPEILVLNLYFLPYDTI